MVHTAHFAAGLLGSYLTAQVLARSTWPWRAPRLAILSWQAIGLALGLSAIGLPITLGLAGYQRPTGSAIRAFIRDLRAGTLPPWLGLPNLLLVGVGVIVAAALLTTTVRILIDTLRAQQRHRELLTLVARDDPAAPGALVLDHPSAAAYCVPGVRPQVVVSAGTLRLLDPAELAAVLRHEQAHAAERHDLVLLPFAALRRAVPWSSWMCSAHERVALLVEMLADDKARESHADAPLVEALLRFAAADNRITPAGTLGLADQDIDVRVQRLLSSESRYRPRLLGTAALSVSVLLVALPMSLYLN